MDSAYILSWTIALLVAIAVVAFLMQRVVQPVTVFEYERGLRFVRGKFVGVAEPGKYWMWLGQTHFQKVDVRLRVLSIAGQEVLSSDGVALKVSISGSFRIADPARAILEQANAEAALYSALQQNLRAILGSSPVEDLLQRRATIGAELLKTTTETARGLGLEIASADLKDLTLPGDLKKIFSQVVRARQEGLAALERARGETAALRNLANAARLVSDNPPLLQLRWLQVLGERSGNTVVLGVPSGPVPIAAPSSGQRDALPNDSDSA